MMLDTSYINMIVLLWIKVITVNILLDFCVKRIVSQYRYRSAYKGENYEKMNNVLSSWKQNGTCSKQNLPSLAVWYLT